MEIRVLDLDGAVASQTEFVECASSLITACKWGPRIRIACSFDSFRRFENALSEKLAYERNHDPALTFFGSGDFHHISLALLRRQAAPFNLVVIDNHPDWMRAVPFLHCGT